MRLYTIERQSTEVSREQLIVSGPSFDACQAGIWEVMEGIDNGSATFTLPTRAANGTWVAIGHLRQSA